MPTISAIVLTFNRADLLGEAIASIEGQTRPPDEILILDDGSTDETRALVESDRKSTRLNSSHFVPSRMPSSA